MQCSDSDKLFFKWKPHSHFIFSTWENWFKCFVIPLIIFESQSPPYGGDGHSKQFKMDTQELSLNHTSRVKIIHRLRFFDHFFCIDHGWPAMTTTFFYSRTFLKFWNFFPFLFLIWLNRNFLKNSTRIWTRSDTGNELKSEVYIINLCNFGSKVKNIRILRFWASFFDSDHPWPLLTTKFFYSLTFFKFWHVFQFFMLEIRKTEIIE